MDWYRDINWFAIHTKRFRESLATSSIDALGLEAFLPMLRVDPSQEAVIKLTSKPLFPGYLFARFIPAISLDSVECARGVLYVIKSGSYPIPVDNEAMLEIQSRVETDGLITLQRRELAPGDKVSIKQGPFAGMMGKVEAEPDDRRRVAILLETLWNARVLIEKLWLEVEMA